MQELDFEPAMVGRDKELKELQAYLDKAAQGDGNSVFISGEAGIGKSRLINELKNYAQSRGFKILSGQSLSESLTPYMPFIEALRSGDLENLFAEEAPRVEAAYLVTYSGLLIEKVLRKETKLEPEIFASMLTTVGNFVKDSLSLLDGEKKDGALDTLGYKNYRILIESGVSANLVVILTGRENEFLIDDMRDTLFKVDNKYGNVLRDWSGHDEDVVGIGKLIETLITSGKYDGIYYGSDDPRARRNLLFENVSLGLTRQAKSSPTLLCIEDLQWSDPSSLSLMHYVARNTRKCRLLILATYRPEDITAKESERHPLVDTMQLMSREDLYEPIELRRLSEENIVSVIQSQFSEIQLSEEFKNRIFKETEGNPLFVIELLKLLFDEKIIDKDDGTWKLIKSLEDVNVPSKIYDVIARRLNRVEKKHRKILDYSSVVGNEFTSELLSTMLDVSRIELLEDLRTLEQKHRLIQSYNGNFRFDHAKIKEVLYNGIPQELKTEYHAIIAGTIESQNKDNLDAVVGDLAYHYYRCRDKDKALTYLVKAAEKAKKEYSNEEAIRFYSEALEFEEETHKRREIFEDLGAIYNLIADYGKSIESNESALKLADEKKKKASILQKIAAVKTIIGELDESLRICNKALALVKGEECKEKAQILTSIGSAYSYKGEHHKALEYSEKGLVIMERIGDLLGIAKLLNLMGIIYANRGEIDRELEYFEKSLEIWENINDKKGIAGAYNNIGNVHSIRGEYDKAFEHYERSLQISEKIGDKNFTATHLLCIGITHLNTGEYAKALEYSQRSLEIYKRSGNQKGIANSIENMGNVHHDRGDYDKALEFHEKSQAIREKIGDTAGLTYNYCGLAATYLKKKDLYSAMEFCEKAFNLSKELGVKVTIAVSRRIFGIIQCERKQWDLSAKNFEESIRIFKEIGMEIYLGKSHYEFGLMWKDKGDIEKAKEQQNYALSIFKKLKLEHRIQKVEIALKNLKSQAYCNGG